MSPVRAQESRYSIKTKGDMNGNISFMQIFEMRL